MTGRKKPSQQRPTKQESGAAQPRVPVQTARGWFYVALAFASVVAVALVSVVWGEPRPIGDYYIALAAGRDMLSSQFASLTQPDTWSFMTDGRVWLNQNWGTHLIYYVAYKLGGELGGLALKALLLATMAAFIVMICRQRGVGWPLAILASGGAVAAGRSFIDLRPNLMTFVFVPLVVWLLYSARGKPHRMWLGPLVMAIWANVHGGFLFGLGVMGLWALSWLVTLSVRRGLGTALRYDWPVLAAVVAAVVVSSTLSPFGIANLTHPFVVGSSAEWRGIVEWRPIYEWTMFGSTREFYIVMSLFVAMPVMCGLAYLKAHNRDSVKLDLEQLGPLIFSVCLCVTLFVLAGRWEIKLGAVYDSLRRDREIALFVTGIVGLAGSFVITLVFASLAKGRFRLVRPGTEGLATLVFEVCIAAIVITMAIKAKRFIPLAIILVVPMVAVQIQWLLRAWGKEWPVIFLAGALVVPAVFSFQKLYRYYHPDNPLLPSHTMFQRMMAYSMYAPGASEFINANNIDGRVFNEWRWEGYLHLMCPQLKVFMGGRAQQVYSLNNYEDRNRVITGPDHASQLERLGIHLIIVPASFRYRSLIGSLVEGPDARWAYIYFDGNNCVLADAGWPGTRELIDRAAAGELKYPDSGIAALSRATCLPSQVPGKIGRKVAQALIEANAVEPTSHGYMFLKSEMNRLQVPPKMSISYWEKQNWRLEKRPVHRAGGFDVLTCRHIVAETLSSLYSLIGQREQAARWAEIAGAIRQDAAAVEDRWGERFGLSYYPRQFSPKKSAPHPGTL